jgi:ATP-dependent Clp protease protease subunit
MLKLIMSMLLLPTIGFSQSFTKMKVERPETIILSDRNTITFNQPVTGKYVAKKQVEIFGKVAKLNPFEPIYLVLDTPGGSVIDGMLFLDTLKSLGRPIHTITIFAASMGYQFVQNLGNRYILPSGTLMSHRGAVSGLSGQVPGELNSRLHYFESILSEMNIIASKRIGMSVEAYEASIVNELWTSGVDAVAKNHADKVVHAKCDSTLTGTYQESIQTFFGPISLTYSQCPLVSAPIKVGFDNSFDVKLKAKALKHLENIRRKVHLNL